MFIALKNINECKMLKKAPDGQWGVSGVQTEQNRIRTISRSPFRPHRGNPCGGVGPKAINFLAEKCHYQSF